VSTLKPFVYDPPSLVNLSSNQTARGACGGGSSANCCQTNGHLASTCSDGGSGGYLSNCTPCYGGDCVYWSDYYCECTGSCVNNCCGGNCHNNYGGRDCWPGTCARGCLSGTDAG
jgi:hypothetical protein